MKALVFLAVLALALIQSAIATPHSYHRKKRNVAVKYEYVTIPTEIIVHVNQYGSTLSVETKGCVTTTSVEVPAEPTLQVQVPASPPSMPVEPTIEVPTLPPFQQTSIPLPPSPPVPPAPPVEEPTTEVPPVQVTSAPQPPPVEQPTTKVPAPASATVSSPPVDENVPVAFNKFGIVYSPYNADSTCKSQDQVYADFQKFLDYPVVRIYGVDCNQVTTVLNAAKRYNMKIFAGIFDLSDLSGGLRTIIQAAKGDWSHFNTISIGNELVNKGQNIPAQVVGAINSARQTLRAAGYKGPVVTVDTFNAMIQHPEICRASDYCAANCHAFFEAYMTPEQAGAYVKEQARQVSAAAGGKRVVITESGWPHAGQANGKAVPSRENQQKAISSLKSSFPDGGIILFSAFDDRWKKDDSWTFGTEKYWGFL
ncbi:hypothetical protein VTN00DRAFT_5633 [Thermoascus crustaceus]|uniref:uncharacterized protein n=1 Tax=Thermoascus crustaceus TaxID=5088 RepID=UPI00374396AA